MIVGGEVEWNNYEWWRWREKIDGGEMWAWR